MIRVTVRKIWIHSGRMSQPRRHLAYCIYIFKVVFINNTKQTSIISRKNILKIQNLIFFEFRSQSIDFFPARQHGQPVLVMLRYLEYFYVVRGIKPTCAWANQTSSEPCCSQQGGGAACVQFTIAFIDAAPIWVSSEVLHRGLHDWL